MILVRGINLGHKYPVRLHLPMCLRQLMPVTGQNGQPNISACHGRGDDHFRTEPTAPMSRLVPLVQSGPEVTRVASLPR